MAGKPDERRLMTVLGRDLLPKIGAALGLDTHEIGGINIDIPFDDFVMVHVKFLANKEHAEELVQVLTDEKVSLHEPLETVEIPARYEAIDNQGVATPDGAKV